MEIVVPVLESDEGNRAEVLLAVAAMLTGGNVQAERVEINLRYRKPGGEVRFMQIAGLGSLDRGRRGSA